MLTSEVLNRAADLIEERGWAQGNCGMSANGPLCLEGAIAAALDVEPIRAIAPRHHTDPPKGALIYPYYGVSRTPAYGSVQEYLDAAIVYDWNDEAGRTVSQVVEVLRACAVIEASREREAARA